MNDSTSTIETDSEAMQTITIQGYDFEAPAPYAEGHVLSIAEAATLNQTLGENLRNNFAKRVKTEKDKAEGGTISGDVLKTLYDEFASYAEEYEFAGKRRSGSTKIDALTREARRIAKGIVMEALRKKDMDPKSLEEGKLDQLISLTIEKRPGILVEAQRRIDAAKSVANEAIGDELGL